MLEDRCDERLEQSKRELSELLQKVMENIGKLKREIADDDANFEQGMKEQRV
jgi:prefoldin subunit 5